MITVRRIIATKRYSARRLDALIEALDGSYYIDYRGCEDTLVVTNEQEGINILLKDYDPKQHDLNLAKVSDDIMLPKGVRCGYTKAINDLEVYKNAFEMAVLFIMDLEADSADHWVSKKAAMQYYIKKVKEELENE